MQGGNDWMTETLYDWQWLQCYTAVQAQKYDHGGQVVKMIEILEIEPDPYHFCSGDDITDICCLADKTCYFSPYFNFLLYDYDRFPNMNF